MTVGPDREPSAVQAPGRIPDQPSAEPQCTARRRAQQAGRSSPGSVPVPAFAFAATMLGTTLPTPLYDIYQAQW